MYSISQKREFVKACMTSRGIPSRCNRLHAWNVRIPQRRHIEVACKAQFRLKERLNLWNSAGQQLDQLRLVCWRASAEQNNDTGCLQLSSRTESDVLPQPLFELLLLKIWVVGIQYGERVLQTWACQSTEFSELRNPTHRLPPFLHSLRQI